MNERDLSPAQAQRLASAPKQYFVEIVSDVNGEVVKRMGPMGRRAAEKVDRGANINLDHDYYATRIVPE